MELSEELREAAAGQYKNTQKKVKIFTDFFYRAGTWKHPRRVIAKSEFNSQGPNNRYVVTNLDGDGQFLYEKLYCARGEMENRIKEQQLDLFADRTSCHEFVSNQFRLLLSSFAYIIMERFRALLLSGSDFAQATCGTIRLNFIRIGACIRRNTRKIYISLSSACPNQNLFLEIARKILLIT